MASKAPNSVTVDAKPYSFSFQPKTTALLVIDMQRDFLLPGGFGEIEGGDLTNVQAAIEPTRQLLEACRKANMTIFHTREGQKPDMSDCPSNKIVRQAECPDTQYKLGIGDKGDMGRLLIRGEYGHDFVDELQPLPGEVVIDKPGKGAFWDTLIMRQLKMRGVTHLLITGVTTECCVATTYREANDRGFECCAIVECTDGHNPPFKTSSLDMLHWSQGLFGFVANLPPLLEALKPLASTSPGDAATPPQTPPGWDGDLRIPYLRAAYRDGLSPVSVIEALYSKIEAYEKVNPGVWIHLLPKDTVLSAAKELSTKYPDKSKLPPLYGVPFTLKDSISVAGLQTTTGCPPLAHVATTTAPVYTSIIDAGAIFLGKVNLDQCATGLTGQRSPYGAPSSIFNSAFISGGSSSGSAVGVGAKLCTFSIATDTAGSGRVPAAFNGVVGFKPTRGTVPFVGITPACLSLDCVAIMAATAQDAQTVWQVVEGFDASDPYAKPPETKYYTRAIHSTGLKSTEFRFGIPPPEALALCSAPYRRMFTETVVKLQKLGGKLQPTNWGPFEGAGKLLYDGSFVLERLASIPDLAGVDAETWLKQNERELVPVIREIFASALARKTTAADVFRDLQAQARFTAEVRNGIFTAAASGVDVLVVPTAPTHFTVDQIKEEPIKRNSILGTFTHCGNVLDLCGVSCPAGTFGASELKDDEEGTLPFGVTFLGGSGTDAEVLKVAGRFEALLMESGDAL